MKGRTKRNRVAWEATAAVLCFGGGILAGLFGSLLTASTWIFGAELHPVVRGLGTALLIAAIPLLISAGYCLDWIERDMEKPLDAASHKGERGSSPVFQTLSATILLSLIFTIPLEVRAQQTIFNVPTTDVLDQGKVYAEVDVPFKPNNDPGDVVPRFSSFVPRVVVGMGGRVEIGLNLTGNIQPGADATTLVPAVKWKVYDGGDNGWAIAIGTHLFIPVRNKSYDLGNHSYVMVQKTFTTKTRVGFGGGVFTKDVVAPNANRGTGMFTTEQPVTSRFGLQADWYTGKHAAGYFTPGGYFKVTKKMTGYAGYSIGNANVTDGNHFLYFEMGYNFN